VLMVQTLTVCTDHIVLGLTSLELEVEFKLIFWFIAQTCQVKEHLNTKKHLKCIY
jgi:hypothetical protein